MVGRALGATRNVASRARSSGGRAVEGAAGRTSRGLHVAGGYASKAPGLSKRIAGGASRALEFGSRHPKSMLGAAGAAIGYGGYRGFNNSRSARSSGGTRF